jgi:TATA-binding protein-associated factor
VTFVLLGLTKCTKFSFVHVASQEDIDELRREYEVYFQFLAEEKDAEPTLPEMATLAPEMFSDDSDDLGMEVEAKMSPEQLSVALGLHSSLPFMFMSMRHRTGANAWDSPNLFAPNASGLVPFQLLWSQLSGLHSLVRNIFTSSDKHFQTCPSMLIADEVGLGKTILALSLVAILNQRLYCQEKNLRDSSTLFCKFVVGCS